MLMKTLAVMANNSKPRAADVLRRVAEHAEALQLELYTDEHSAGFFKQAKAVSSSEIFDLVDGVVALGGDGTMLRVARSLNGRQTLLMGVNIGSLGFLTSVTENDLETGLDCLAHDRYLVSHRSVASIRVERNGEKIAGYRGLNDVVVSRGPSSRVVTLEVAVGKDPVTSYVCDGLILSTPTGSTGHSLSAGGPILTPDTAAFVLCLICPHTLSSRPLVVPDRSDITVHVAECSGELLLSVDGQVDQRLSQGDVVHVTRSPRDVRFALLPDYSYYAVLRQKLHWRGKSV